MRRLVEAGAHIVTVVPEQPPLEEVYLRLLQDDARLRRCADDPNHRSSAQGTGGSSSEPGSVHARRPDRGCSRLCCPSSSPSSFRFSPASGCPTRAISRLRSEMYRDQPALANLDPEGAIQAWIFQQFLVLLVLTPVAGSMSVAAYSVIGEKQARTLEPLLATPLTTFELLTAKVLGALLPALALTVVCFAVYVGGVAIFAEPGVFRALLSPSSLTLILLLGPLAALAALQLAVCVSSRVNDARSAQQIGALIVLPIAGYSSSSSRAPFVSRCR